MKNVLWRTQATVVGIGQLKTWSKASSSGKFKIIQLHDKLDTQPHNRIHLTLFNNAVDKFDFIQLKKEYIFSEGSIKQARFKDNLKHPYQINMDDKCGRIEPLTPLPQKKSTKPIAEIPIYTSQS